MKIKNLILSVFFLSTSILYALPAGPVKLLPAALEHDAVKRVLNMPEFSLRSVKFGFLPLTEELRNKCKNESRSGSVVEVRISQSTITGIIVETVVLLSTTGSAHELYECEDKLHMCYDF